MKNTAMTQLPVTIEITRKVRPECCEKFERELKKLIRFAMTAPGHLGANVLQPPGNSTEYRVIIKFRSEKEFRRFQETEGLRTWYRRIRPLLLEEPKMRIMEGLEAWFAQPERPRQEPPEAWKMALVTWVGVYVCVMAFTYGLHAIGIRMPLPLEVAVVAALTVAALQWALMPWATRRLRNWLKPKRR